MKIDIKEKIKLFRNKHILVIGDVMLDKYINGNVSRLSPEAPVPVVDVKNKFFHAGGAANVARNINGLGGKVTLIGLIGDDDHGEALKTILKQDNGISQELIQHNSINTTVKTRILGNNQQLIRLDEEKKIKLNKIIINKILEKIKKNGNSIDGIIIQDYDKGLINDNLVSEIILYASKKDILIYVDPKINIFPSYFNVRLFKPNLIEFNNFVGEYKNFEDVANRLIIENNYQILLVTKGSKGMSLFYEGKHVKIPINIRQVHDVSGAGDTVISTFALCDLINLPPDISAYIANIAAGKVCEKVGVVPITCKLLVNNINEDFI